MQKSKSQSRLSIIWVLKIGRKKMQWTTKLERIAHSRKGLPYESIEVISKKADLPVKTLLFHLNMAQTTYNKKKKSNDLLDKLEGELILVLAEVLQFGIIVFNGEEEKFQQWLKEPNLSIGGVAPNTLFDTLTGVQEVHNALSRIEYGNMA